MSLENDKCKILRICAAKGKCKRIQGMKPGNQETFLFLVENMKESCISWGKDQKYGTNLSMGRFKISR